jgi:Putative Tad-like Flp pilus-assembly
MIHLIQRHTATGGNSEHSHDTKHRRGNVLVLAALLLVFVFTMVAFAIDIGYIVHVDTEFQRTADACALAAARKFPDLDAARDMAKSVAQENAHVEGPVLTDNDIIFGHWNRRTATWTAGGSDINAVRVLVRRTAETGNPLGLFFARAMGHNVTDIQAEAIAMCDNQLCGPLVGIDWASVPGTPSTDSYWSEDGYYWEQEPGLNGSICSDGMIYVDGTADVHGNANPGRDCETIVGSNAVVTGNTVPRIRPMNMPLVDDSQAELINDNGILPPIPQGHNFRAVPDANGDFILDGGKHYTMPSGTFYFRDFILTGQSELNITGDTVVYVTRTMDTSGGDVINATMVPQNLRVYSTGTYVRIAGNSDFFGTVYAPQADVELTGNAGWYGAFVGKTMTVTGTGDIHYDENLDFSGEVPLPNRTGLVR